MCARGNDVKRNEKFHVRKIDHIDINHIEREKQRGKLHKLDDGQVMYLFAHVHILEQSEINFSNLCLSVIILHAPSTLEEFSYWS